MPALFVLANALVDYLKSAVSPSIFKIPVLDEERGALQEVLDEKYDTVPVIICGLLLWQNGKKVVQGARVGSHIYLPLSAIGSHRDKRRVCRAGPGLAEFSCMQRRAQVPICRHPANMSVIGK